METKERIIHANGVDIHTITVGNGKPILVVGSAIYYPRTFSKSILGQHKWVFTDCRLFIPTPENYDMATPLFDQMADDLEAVRKELDLGKVTILGHSIHGLIALEYARRYPESVIGTAVLASPAFLGEALDAEFQKARKKADPARLAIIAERWEAFGGQEKLATMQPDETIIPSYLNNGPLYWYDMHFDAAPLWEGVKGNATLFMHLMMTQAIDYDLSKEPIVSTPVFVALGRHDLVVPHTLWSETEQVKLPKLTLHLFEKSGHTPQLEQPEEFDWVFHQWMRSL